MKIALIDIGSNTIKLNIFELTENDECLIYKKSIQTSLGLHKVNGYLDEIGKNKLVDTLQKYIDICLKNNCDKVFPFATASLRGITNTDEVLNSVRCKLGLSIDILSGEDEAYFDYLGISKSFDSSSRGIILDMGGGSCEAIHFSNDKIDKLYSMPFGCLSLKKQFSENTFLNENEKNNIKEYIKNKLRQADFNNLKENRLYLIGGTAKCILSLMQNVFKFDKSTFDINSLKMLMKYFSSRTEQNSGILNKIADERADFILCGLVAYSCMADIFQSEIITVSDLSVREGYLKKIRSSNYLL